MVFPIESGPKILTRQNFMNWPDPDPRFDQVYYTDSLFGLKDSPVNPHLVNKLCALSLQDTNSPIPMLDSSTFQNLWIFGYVPHEQFVWPQQHLRVRLVGLQILIEIFQI